MKHEWGSQLMVTRGKLYDVLQQPGFVALVNGEPQGIITYHIENSDCEILILHSALEGYGIGAALVENVKQVAQAAGCKRLWLITTNDNIHAIRWYQKRGFTIAAVHVNALEQSRKLKPQIPLIGNENIPLRDEFEFEITLK
jgi:GNAT superfamily N-acetyltransferase